MFSAKYLSRKAPTSCEFNGSGETGICDHPALANIASPIRMAAKRKPFLEVAGLFNSAVWRFKLANWRKEIGSVREGNFESCRLDPSCCRPRCGFNLITRDAST